MHLKIEKGWKKVLFYVGIIGTLTGGFTVAGGIQWLHAQWKIQETVRITNSRIDSFYVEFELYKSRTDGLIEHIFYKVHLIEDVNEMDFFFGRSMTDPFNSTMYEITDESTGEKFDVEIRKNNEGKLFGFVYIMNIKYTLYRDTDGAEIRYYVMLHDIGNDENKNTYLVPK